jgi:hypothetical protein
LTGTDRLVRDVEELLAARGIEVSRESLLRSWTSATTVARQTDTVVVAA